MCDGGNCNEKTFLQNNSEGLAKAAKIEGDTELLQVLMSNMNQCKRVIYGGFNIVEP